MHNMNTEKTDTLQRFMFEHANIRGEIAHLSGSYQTIMNQQPYPLAVKQLLGEALVSCVLLTGSIKFEGEVSIQFYGDARLPLLNVQCDHLLHVRGFAQYQEGVDAEDYQQAFLQGKMVVMINHYQHAQSYQSIVPIRSASMSENLMYYLAQSEQISSQIWLAVNDEAAAGVLLQLMPDQGSLEREQFWEYAVTLGQTLTTEELLALDNPTILHRLYHEEDLRLFDARSIAFQCRCSREKMKRALETLRKEEINSMLQEKERIEVVCDFCHQHYYFDAIDLAG